MSAKGRGKNGREGQGKNEIKASAMKSEFATADRFDSLLSESLKKFWRKDFYPICVHFFLFQEFILNQDWNDPKSQLQQCCLTLRTEGKEPDIPLYK